jgi:hypothetical protein
MGRIGLPEMFLIFGMFGIVGGVLTVVPLWQICKKAGFPPALALLGLVPIANIVLMFVLAFAEWPAFSPSVSNEPRRL